MMFQFVAREKDYLKALHVQMLPYFLYLLRRFISTVQPRECAKITLPPIITRCPSEYIVC